jgi:ATP-dependent RNA/DNA helicase IGHMBP2
VRKCNEPTGEKRVFNSYSACVLLKDVLLGDREPEIDKVEKVKCANIHLNERQQLAVAHCLACKDLAIVHGPPGTGKTTTVVEIILQEVKRCRKVLACGPSNISVDNMLDKLVFSGVKCCRIGHPSRVLEHLHNYTLDALVMQTNSYQIARQAVADYNQLIQKIYICKNKSDRLCLTIQAKKLKKDNKKYYAKAVEEVLSTAKVILCTNASAGDKFIAKFYEQNSKRPFDVCVIDECAQATEPSSWIPLIFSRKLIIAGDHRQLEPTIKSLQASHDGLNITLFERMINKYPNTAIMLTVQYRMNDTINNWSSNEMYGGMLVADKSVANQEILVKKQKAVEEAKCDLSLFSKPLLFIDTAGCMSGESIEEDTIIQDASKYNEGYNNY